MTYAKIDTNQNTVLQAPAELPANLQGLQDVSLRELGWVNPTFSWTHPVHQPSDGDLPAVVEEMANHNGGYEAAVKAGWVRKIIPGSLAGIGYWPIHLSPPSPDAKITAWQVDPVNFVVNAVYG